MANIKNFNFNKFDFHLSKSDYWDLFLALDEYDSSYVPPLSTGSCQVVWFDFNNPEIFAITGDSIHSITYWTGATNSGYTFDTIGLTGIDNGLILFDKLSADTSNQALLSALTGSTLVIPSGDTKFFMNPVSGTTGDFIYPINLETQTGTTFSSFTYSNFCGGFYQGFYKIDGYDYQVLPVRVEHSWSSEFILKPQDICTETGQTLNDVYSGNTGFFFYMGTRAENKFWNQWYGNNTGCTSGCTVPLGCTDTVTEFCTIPKEIDISLVGDYGVEIPLDPPQITTSLITNGFLIYGRGRGGRCGCSACSGPNDGLGNQTVCSYAGTGVVVTHTAEVITNTTNGFLIYGRGRGSSSGCTCSSCSGPNDGYGNQTVCSFSGRGSTIAQTQIDYTLDEYDNALGFRITPDGRIGYRLLGYTAQTISGVCVTAVTVEEGYSEPNMVSGDVWSYVVVKFKTNFLEGCELELAKPRKGRLSFYINGKLKYFVDDFDEFIARRLIEYKDKQIAVPFKMSLGGGSQGLLESQTFDGQDPRDLGLAIEENFAGTFIGGIAQFKFNICDLGYQQIQYNYTNYAPMYGISIKTHGNC
jgi:hypothetical protein